MSGRARLTLCSAAATLLASCALLPLVEPATWLLQAAFLLAVQSGVGAAARRVPLARPLTVAVQALVTLMALTLVGGRVSAGSVPTAAGAGAGGNTKALGSLVYTEYVYPFEIAAVVLLVAIIAAIALTHRTRRDSKYQKPGDQVKVRPRDRLRVLQMPSEKREPQ